MSKKFTLIFIYSLITFAGFFFFAKPAQKPMSGAPPYGEAEKDIPDLTPFSWLRNWQRPTGPPKVALQVGHWKNEELPDELINLRGKSTGAVGGGKQEWEVNLAIARETAKILESKGIETEILPATVPVSYWADVFIAIHADGSNNRQQTGFKAAAPWRDFSDKANDLVLILEKNYQRLTGLTKDEKISRNMRGYYAFSWWHYSHAIHPMTTAVILETGFLTSASDRKLIVDNPQIPAEGIAEGVLEFLKLKNLIKTPPSSLPSPILEVKS